MRLHNLTLVLLFISIMITGNAQDLQIAGGGTIMDWANLKFYQDYLVLLLKNYFKLMVLEGIGHNNYGIILILY